MANNNNPIKTSQMVENDGVLEQVRKELEALRAEYAKLLKGVKEDAAGLKKATDGLGAATSEQTDLVFEQAKAADKLAKNYIKYQVSLTDTGKKLKALSLSQREANRLATLEAKLNANKVGSYDRLSAEMSILKIRYKKLTEAEVQNTKAGQALVARINEINDNLKAQDKSLGVTSRNVGNYKEDIKAAVDEMGGFPGAAGQVVGGVRGMRTAFKALLANPVVLFVAALVAGLGALFNAFTRSEKGAKLMTKVTGLVNAGMSQLVDVADAVAGALGDAFDDPLGALKNLGEAILKNLINRMTAVIPLGLAIGKALKALWNRDLKALKEAGTDAFAAVNQAITGLDAQQQSDLANAIRETTEELTKEAAAFIKLEQTKKSVRTANRNLQKSVESLATAEGLARSIADDTTKSFQERETAAEQARVALEKRSKLEAQIARNNLSTINQEIGLRRANGEQIEDLLDQQLAAYQAVAQAERDATLAVRDNERTRAELRQDRLERDLDILIDGFDNQKTINERLIADDRNTFAERRALLDETLALSDRSFAKQIETIQKFTGIQVDANELIGESDAVRLNQKIRSLGLSEIIEGRLLEIVRDRKSAVQELNSAAADLEDAEAAAAAKRLADAEAQRKADEAAKKARIESRLQDFDEQAALDASILDLNKRTEAQKTKDRLTAEAARLQAVIDINTEEEGNLSDTVVETYRNRIKGIQAEISKIENPEKGKGLLAQLGIEISGDQLAALKGAFDFVKSQILDVFNLQKQLADQGVQNANTRVQNANDALQAELAAQAAGDAANVETARQKVEREKKLQEEALERQKKADKAQRRIQTAQQAGNLITAVSKIFAELPIFAAIPAVALMFGSFVAGKIKAGKLARENNSKGNFETLDYGTSHEKGDDIYLGRTKKGKARYAEKDEGLSIWSRKAMKANGPKIKAITDLFNKGSFDDVYIARELLAGGEDPAIIHNTTEVDMTSTNRILSGIRGNTSVRESRNHKGQRVVTQGWTTTTYVE